MKVDQVQVAAPDVDTEWRSMGMGEGFERRGDLLVPTGVAASSVPVTAMPTTVFKPDTGKFLESAPGKDDESASAEVASVVEKPLSAEVLPMVRKEELPQLDGRSDVATVPTGFGRWGRRRGTVSAEELGEELEARRAIVDVERDDELARLRSAAEHQMAVAAVKERQAMDTWERQERQRDAREGEELKALYRQATLSGARAKVQADIQRSAEMRALRVNAVRRYALWAGLPIVVGFGAFSTPGVQKGMAQLLGMEPYSAGWWTAWLVEPLLLAVAVGVIVVKAVLAMSGGQTDWRATATKWGALVCSIALNMLGGWSGQAAGWGAAIGEALGHSLGAIGAAVSAWALGAIVDYTSKARPWEDAPRLSELDITLPSADATDGFRTASGSVRTATTGSVRTGSAEGVRTPIMRGKLGPAAGLANGLPDEDPRLLDVVRKTKQAITEGRLSPDPSGYAIYRQVMEGKGDRDRAGKAARALTGWRPDILHAV